MRVAIASVQVPFISGGAELLTENLRQALLRAGHAVEVVTRPFRFGPPSAVLKAMDEWHDEDFNQFGCGPIDLVLSLKFPAFYLQHPNHRVWLMHQHRSVYELFNTSYGEQSADPAAASLRRKILKRDTESLRKTRSVFTISAEVSERLSRFNGIESQPLPPPPPSAELYHAAPAMPFVFVPGRLETLKRQELLIRAMAFVDEPVFALVAGDGGQRHAYERLVAELGLAHRVKFLGRIDDEQMRRHYAHSLGVFFGPHLEDHGFVALEAMLSSRPVITCTDSGGPVNFVRDGETGFITEPRPEAVATAINTLWADRRRAASMGASGLMLYRSLKIGWDHILPRLLAP